MSKNKIIINGPLVKESLKNISFRKKGKDHRRSEI